jgi:hypothetical protein
MLETDKKSQIWWHGRDAADTSPETTCETMHR